MTVEQWIDANGFQALMAAFKAAAKHQGILDPNDQYTFARQCMIALRHQLTKQPIIVTD